MNDSLTKKDIINNFHEYKNPLLIYGRPGCGKSYLANELLKDTILLRIDLNLLRGIQNSKEYILDRLKKKNITLMFKNINEQRGLLIDDIHIFYKYDKILYKSIIEFIKDKKYYGSKIILTCCTSFLKNKDLFKLNIQNYEIKYNKSEYYKICLEILKDKEIKLSGGKCDNLIYYSNNNLNKFINELNILCNESSDKFFIKNKDNFDSLHNITINLLRNKYSFNEIISLCENDEIIIGFNLLENSLLFIKDYERSLYKIYEYYTISDSIETFTIKNHDRLIKNYSMGLSICVINYYINKYYKENNISNIIYNKYISRTMANVISLNIYRNNNLSYSDELIYLLYTLNKLKLNKLNKLKLNKYKNKILEIYNKYPKETKIIINKFNFFYNYKFNLKMMYQ